MVKGKFAKLILEGRKTTTIRLGRVIPKAREIIIHSEGRPIAEAVITNVIYKKVKELTEEDAKHDGYESLDELLKDLKNMYGTDIKPDDEVTIIEFSVVKRFDNIDATDVYLGFSPLTIALLANRYLKNKLSGEERRIIDAILRYKSIRTVALKLYGSLNKRWVVRRTLRYLLARLVDEEVVKVDEESLKKLANISSFWRKYLEKRKAGQGTEHRSNKDSKTNI
jgi:hypothetical protein